jgi:hypothetical protein
LNFEKMLHPISTIGREKPHRSCAGRSPQSGCFYPAQGRQALDSFLKFRVIALNPDRSRLDISTAGL